MSAMTNREIIAQFDKHEAEIRALKGNITKLKNAMKKLEARLENLKSPKK